MRERDGRGGVFAVGARPALPQPIDAVETRGVLLLHQRWALLGYAAHHRVDEAGHALLIARTRNSDGGRHGGVGGGAEKQKLRRTQPQCVADHLRRRTLDELRQDRVDLAEASQRGGDEQAHKGAVARMERGDFVVESLVSGTAVYHHALQHIQSCKA